MTRNFPPGDIRVSDADRDAAIAELSEHFQAGRLTHEEFDERAGLALRARTGNDLNELFTDLPLTGAAARPTAPQDPLPPWSPPIPPPRMERRHPHPAVAIVPLVIMGIVASNLVSASGSHHGGWVIPLIVVLILVRYISRRARR